MNDSLFYQKEYENDIAIIGINGRFPSADNIDIFWEKVKSGVDMISTAWGSSNENTSNMRTDTQFVKVNTQIDKIDLFDAGFFGFTSREAEIMDPQQRIFLECAWEVLESAGYTTDSYTGTIALFAGCSTSTYLLNNLLPNRDLLNSISEIQIMIGNDKDHLTTQTAYKMNLKGPCMSVQTSCSTSLVSIHLACESLLGGQCDLALAGGVTIKTPHLGGYKYSTGGLVSVDGRCHTFDSNATGTVYSDGIGIVALKRYPDAAKDGDNIIALIKGSAVNSDGSDRVGYTAPGVNGQCAVITEALEVARINPSTIGYIEAHGTGTPLGDTIEIEALTKAFSFGSDKKGFCALGSVKTNIGHAEIAAGVAGLIKAALAVKHGLIPPSLNFEEPNPNINWEDSPFYVNTILAEWKTNDLPRRAGISSFGLGGINAHIILEEAPSLANPLPDRACDLFVLSAKTRSALCTYCNSLVKYLDENQNISISDAVYTLKLGRKIFNHRYAVNFKSKKDLVDALKDTNKAEKIIENKFHKVPVAFILGENIGTDSNFINQMYNQIKPFQENIEICATVLKKMSKHDLLKDHFNDMADSKINLFALQYSMTKTWIDLGIAPQALYGSGIGQFTAAAIAFNIEIKTCFEILNFITSSTPYKDVIEINSLGIPVFAYATGDAISKHEVSDFTYWKNVINNDENKNGNILVPIENSIILDVDHIQVFGNKQNYEKTLKTIHSYEEYQACELFMKRTGELWLAGCEVDWEQHYMNEKRLRVPLPTYPFERKRYWVEEQFQQKKAEAGSISHLSSNSFNRDGLSSQYIAASDEIQVEIVRLWEEQLGIAPIGIEDNFFELGGYSLVGASIVTRINNIFKSDLYLRQLFENPTISQLAMFIANTMISSIDDNEFSELLNDAILSDTKNNRENIL